jgi:hypothetical protein
VEVEVDMMPPAKGRGKRETGILIREFISDKMGKDSGF